MFLNWVLDSGGFFLGGRGQGTGSHLVVADLELPGSPVSISGIDSLCATTSI